MVCGDQAGEILAQRIEVCEEFKAFTDGSKSVKWVLKEIEFYSVVIPE